MRRNGNGTRGKTVIWAVDPFESAVHPPVFVVRELLSTVRRAGLELLPVHVVSIIEKQWETGEMPSVPLIQVALDRYLQHFNLGDDVRARVIVDEDGTRLSAVRSLLELAEQEAAEWITVSTHGRSGAERLMLGSFAERLVEHSPLPVVFLPRQLPRAEALSQRVALFPTDLSAPAHVAFSKFLAVAQEQRLEIAIFHALNYPVPSMDFGLGPVGLGPVLPESFVEDQTAWANARGASLVEEAHAHGVRAHFCLHTGLVPSITGRAVLAAARAEHARMIAMPSMTGPVTRFIAGSVAQEVFREGRALTWLYGPKALEEKEAKAA